MGKRFDWAGAALVITVVGVLLAAAAYFHWGHKVWFVGSLVVLAVLFVVLVVAALVGRRETVHADHAAQLEHLLKVVSGSVGGDRPHGITGREQRLSTCTSGGWAVSESASRRGT